MGRETEQVVGKEKASTADSALTKFGNLVLSSLESLVIISTGSGPKPSSQPATSQKKPKKA